MSVRRLPPPGRGAGAIIELGSPRTFVRRHDLGVFEVLVNLILNAVDAMCFVVTDREKLLTIKSEAYEPNQVRISIEDSGPGVDAGHMEHIFDAFFTTKPRGMGMGLSVCRSIVESLGGRIWAETRSPHGALFYVQLPSVHSAPAIA
jgi:signal transduction histidine kinase